MEFGCHRPPRQPISSRPPLPLSPALEGRFTRIRGLRSRERGDYSDVPFIPGRSRSGRLPWATIGGPYGAEKWTPVATQLGVAELRPPACCPGPAAPATTDLTTAHDRERTPLKSPLVQGGTYGSKRVATPPPRQAWTPVATQDGVAELRPQLLSGASGPGYKAWTIVATSARVQPACAG